MKKSIETVLMSMAGFSAGIATGLLLSSKRGGELRETVSIQSEELKAWVDDKKVKFLSESELKINSISKKLQSLIPDLYEATSSINFEEEDLEFND